VNEREIFLTAMDITDAEAREEFLDSACGGDQKLHDRVVRLLQRSLSNDGFLESPASALVNALDPLNETQASDDGSATAGGGLETRTLGDFRILDEIGRGGMGVVYEAEQISLGRRVALKVLSYASMLNKTQLVRFRNEARAAASLDHPNVVHVHSVGSHRGVHYYAMQLIDGQTVGDVIHEQRRHRALDAKPAQSLGGRRSSPDDPTGDPDSFASSASHGPEVLKDTGIANGTSVTTANNGQEKDWIRSVVALAIQAAEAVEHAHRMGIVHRDIKPSNLLVDSEQHLWVADFGLAMVEAESNLTATGSMIGTLRYMSPEQMRGDRHVLDHRTDIYSLGATLYEMLTLRAAFPDSDATRLIERIPIDDPTAPRRLNPIIPRDVETIVLKAMAKDPVDRYATAGELAADLRRFRDDEPIHARRPWAVERVRKWSRRHRGIVATGLGTLTVAALIAGGLLWHERQETLAAYAAEKKQYDLALRNEAEAKHQARAAEKESARAEENLDLALAALDAIYLDAIGREKLMGESVAAPERESENKRGDRASLTALERELLRRGLAFYDRFAQQNASSPRAAVQGAQAFYRVALLQAGLGEPQAALTSYQESAARFRQLIQDQPDRADLWAQLADVYAGMANTLPEWTQAKDALSQARVAYARASQIEPQTVKYHVLRGDIGLRMLDPQALDDYEKALELATDKVGLHLKLSKLHRDNAFGRRDQNKALEHAERAFDLAPGNPATHLAMAAAIEFLSRSIGKTTIFIDKKQRTRAVVPKQQRILEHYARAIALAPDQVQGYRERCGFLTRIGEYQRALADLDRSLELAPQDQGARYQRASIYVSLDRFEEAITEFNAFLRANPHSKGAYEQLGLAYGAVGKWREAVEAFSQYLERDPSRFHIYKRRAYASIYLQDYEQVLKDLESSLSLNKNDTSALWWLPHDQVAQAPESFKARLVDLANEAVARSPSPSRAYADRGLMYLDLHNYEAAITSLNKSLELDTTGASLPNTTFLLAVAHWQLGNKAEARACYDKSVRWMKDNESTDEQLVRLKAKAEVALGIDSETEASKDDQPPEDEKSPPESPEGF
jgi:serine/threonine protein kinase/tetratricopeptide (TPR) repeat protein